VAVPLSVPSFQRLTEFGITWYEEPCLADNIELLAEVRRAVPIPIVTGEALYSKEQFFHALERRAGTSSIPTSALARALQRSWTLPRWRSRKP